MRIPAYKIFSGSPDKDALWIESVEGLGAANDRMKQIAAEKPGRYFNFSLNDRVILSLHRYITRTGIPDEKRWGSGVTSSRTARALPPIGNSAQGSA